MSACYRPVTCTHRDSCSALPRGTGGSLWKTTTNSKKPPLAAVRERAPLHTRRSSSSTPSQLSAVTPHGILGRSFLCFSGSHPSLLQSGVFRPVWNSFPLFFPTEAHEAFEESRAPSLISSCSPGLCHRLRAVLVARALGQSWRRGKVSPVR